MLVNLSRINEETNYSIVGGTTAPANPEMNTIWVNTDSAITGCVFAEDYPTEPYEGMLFIKTNSSAVDSFSVYKPYTVMVYPMYAKQYIAGEWNSVITRRYHDGTYTSWWTGDLLNTNITGGLSSVSSNIGVSISGRSITVTVYPSSSEYFSSGDVHIKNKIDLTDWKQIKLVLTHYNRLSTQAGATVTISVLESLNSQTPVVRSTMSIGYSSQATTSSTTVNVSNLEGLYYIRLGVSQTTNATSNGAVTAHIDTLTLL